MEHAPLIQLSEADLHQEEHVVLRGVELEARAGEFIYLIGRTGSGKSSLLKTLYGELPLTSGTGMVCGMDLRTLKQRKVHLLRRKLGIVFQDFELLTDRTAEQNLQFVLKVTDWKDAADRERRIAEVLEAVGLENKGYKRPLELSGGERQRLAIARALLNAPDLILADEPTGNLDPETAEGILTLLHNLAREGRCILMATHNHDILKRHPGRVLRCQNGKLEEIQTATAPQA
ncbi:MAG: ATP-binding cassette domain-containing protein [Flavobacteriales bacterium]|nr:ATP-binding cassette domain-containing protein [Flavobacteriales bacterium]